LHEKEKKKKDLLKKWASFLLDSGAGRHCSYEIDRFKNFVFGDFGGIQVADGSTVEILGVGDIDIRLGNDTVTLKNGACHRKKQRARKQQAGPH